MLPSLFDRIEDRAEDVTYACAQFLEDYKVLSDQSDAGIDTDGPASFRDWHRVTTALDACELFRRMTHEEEDGTENKPRDVELSKEPDALVLRSAAKVSAATHNPSTTTGKASTSVSSMMITAS